VTCLVLAFEVVDLGYPSEAHQAEARHNPLRGTLTVLENKMPLLQPSSAFLISSIVPRVKCLSLADLHRVPAMTAWHLADLAASALCPAC